MSDLIQKNGPALSLSNGSLLRSKLAMLIAWAAMILFALHASTHMVGAGDTWVAMACGRHFINHGVDTNEPFSANSHREGPTAEEVATWPKWAQKITDTVGLDTVKYWHPTGWVNQNWLTHVIFYWLTHLSPFADADNWSFNTLVYWKFLIYILTVICVYYTARVLGVHPALAAVSACAAMFISRSLIDIRPAGFSNLLVAVFMLILALATYRNHLYIWLMVPMTVFWSNVHGGYIYVFIMFAPIVILRLLEILSKRATVSLYSILTWLALFAAMYKYTSHEPFLSFAAPIGKLLFLLAILIIVSVVLALLKQINAAAFYGFHIFVSLIVFAVLLARFFPKDLPVQRLPQELLDYVNQSRFSFFAAFLAAIGLGLIVTLLKKQLLVTSPAAVAHTAAAAFTAFIASIVFNPFHLTNLTHTFIISISPQAEGWRNVHEWWPAFKWENPVGSAFPYLVMLVLGGGVLALWVFGRFLVPGQVRMGKGDLEIKQKRFGILSKILGFATAMVATWVVMLSFSMLDVSLSGFLLAGLFTGIIWASVVLNVHFIYLIVPFSIFALQAADKGAGFTGRYIYPFITVPAYAAMFAIASRISGRPKYRIENIFFVLAGAVTAIILSAVIVNPFRFQESVWHLEQFWGIKRLWSPIYEANLELTYSNLFAVLYGLSGLCVVLWLAAPVVKELLKTPPTTTFEGRQDARPKTPDRVDGGVEFKLPKIDLALIMVAALTAYMAFRSRRFITIAGYAACPVLAMLTQQVLCAAGAAINFYRRGRLETPRITRGVERFIIAASIVVVGGLGIAWGHKFKVVYLDAWPNDTKLNSMFIRMTASHAKPFYACEFMTLNKMAGNMFNYWTEGGFIAWGQEPDPQTGRTPLQLFMDGRAQAAYDYSAYIRWAEISSGGPIVQRARMRNQTLTTEDYLQAGDWIQDRLKESNVWVVLMPEQQVRESAFVKGLEHSRNWRLVFMNDRQRLYVDITDPRGEKIFKGITDGTTLYPDEYSRNVILAHTILMFEREPDAVAQGVEFAIRAVEENPSRTPAHFIQIYYEQYPATRERIDAFWKKYLDDYLANEKVYLNQDGYVNRATIAIIATTYMMPAAQKAGDKEAISMYIKKQEEMKAVIGTMSDKRW